MRTARRDKAAGTPCESSLPGPAFLDCSFAGRAMRFRPEMQPSRQRRACQAGVLKKLNGGSNLFLSTIRHRRARIARGRTDVTQLSHSCKNANPPSRGADAPRFGLSARPRNLFQVPFVIDSLIPEPLSCQICNNDLKTGPGTPSNRFSQLQAEPSWIRLPLRNAGCPADRVDGPVDPGVGLTEFRVGQLSRGEWDRLRRRSDLTGSPEADGSIGKEEPAP